MPWPKGRPRAAKDIAALRRGFANMSEESKARMRRSGVDNGQWKDGKYADERGYVLVATPGRTTAGSYEYEHRLVVEELLGRKLSSEEIVHHKDENKSNNDPSNLEVVSKERHMEIHASIRERTSTGTFG